MGCLCSKIIDKPTIDKSTIDILDFTKGSGYEYLMPRGQIIVQIDEKFKVPVLILDFGKCTPKYVRLWPDESLQKIEFLNFDRAPSPTPFENSERDSGYDTVF